VTDELEINGFLFRAMRPGLDGQALSACGTPIATGAKLCTSDAEGFTGMKASAAIA
jgi:hydroxyacyl-ACP dehydratase HTD2-like protein with hotdog domain